MGKKSLMLCGILTLIVIVSACFESSNSYSEESQDGEADVSDQSLSMIVSSGGSGDTFGSAAEMFTEETGIQVNVVDYPYAETRENQLLELSNNTGNIDIVMIDGEIWLAELEEYLEPLDYADDEIDHLISSMVDIFRSDQDELYALPVRIGGWVLMYREDLFEEEGLEVPETWDEFLHIAQTLTKDGMYGFAPAMGQTNYLTAQWLPFLRSFGAEILTEDQTSAAFNNEQGIKATQFFVELYTEHQVVPSGAITYEHDHVVTSIQQGESAMALTFSPNYLPMNDSESSLVADNMAVSPIIPYDPDSGLDTGITEVSGWGFGIAEMSENKEAAQKFIEFVTSDEIQLRMAMENNNAPTASAVYEHEEYLEQYPAAPEIAQALESARSRPGVENWTQIEDILAAELSAAINNIKTVEEALDEAEEAVNNLLD